MAKLELTALTKTYPGGNTAVEGASIDIADGEFIVLVGPSGCGKSTILRMIAGLESVSGGEVRIGGEVVNHLEPGQRDIAMVFQNYALYPHMSVYDNMAYGLKNQGMKRDEIAARIDEAARVLQLGDYLKRRPGQLSGGQRQRVAMGRAIVREPKVFLFDEPLSNLDAKLRSHMRGELKELHRRLGATFVYVTHDQVEAMSLADRIVIMSEGRIEQIGTPMEIYASPASTFVAEFIGSPPMNVVPVDSGLGRVLATLASPPHGTASLGLRPEHLRLAEGGPITARIAFREALGAETVLHLDAPDSPRIALRMAGHLAADDGAQIALSADPEDLTAFDAKGRRIATP